MPAADQHAAAPGMRDGVADEIAQDALQQHRIEFTTALLGLTRSDKPFCTACGAYSARNCSSSGLSGNHLRRGSITPASSLEILSKASNRCPIAAVALAMLSTR